MGVGERKRNTNKGACGKGGFCKSFAIGTDWTFLSRGYYNSGVEQLPPFLPFYLQILGRPAVVKPLPGPSLPKLMAQFNIDVDSGIIRISQLIHGICPGMSQATLFSQSIRCIRTYQRGTRPSEKGAEYTFDLWFVLLGTVTGECSPRRLPSIRTVPVLDTLTVGEPYMSPWAPGLHVWKIHGK